MRQVTLSHPHQVLDKYHCIVSRCPSVTCLNVESCVSVLPEQTVVKVSQCYQSLQNRRGADTVQCYLSQSSHCGSVLSATSYSWGNNSENKGYQKSIGVMISEHPTHNLLFCYNCITSVFLFIRFRTSFNEFLVRNFWFRCSSIHCWSPCSWLCSW